jgi:uncharacterized surface protein with fasciclin (FAS1) repeats
MSCSIRGNINSDNDGYASKSTTLSKGQPMVDVSTKNIIQITMGSDLHTTLLAGVKATGLEAVSASLTVFVTANAAFDKLRN